MAPGPAFRLRSGIVFLGWGPCSSCDLGGVWLGCLGGSAFGLSPPKPWGRRGVWGAWFLHDRSTVSLNACRKLLRGPGPAGAGGRWAKPQPALSLALWESPTYTPSTVPLGHPGARPCLWRLACPAGLCVNFAGPTCLGGSWGWVLGGGSFSLLLVSSQGHTDPGIQQCHLVVLAASGFSP